MKSRSRAIVILTILVGYVLLQFIWWEILLVRQTSAITRERERLAALSISDASVLGAEISALQKRKTNQILMIVGEGTVFLLLLLYGIFRIRKAQEQELALTARQNNFFLSVTHELKTPISAMKLQLQTLKKPQLGYDVQQELITGALAENERLNGLIDNILLASRLDAGGMELRREKADAGKITGQTLQRYYKQQLDAGIIEFHSEGETTCELDPGAFTSILTNLVDNAIKYSGTEPKITVNVFRRDRKVAIQVCDKGPGISAAEKKKVFDRFYRSGAEDIRTTKGTGLGLYIVRNLAQGHGASVRVRDNQPTGCIFELLFDAR